LKKEDNSGKIKTVPHTSTMFRRLEKANTLKSFLKQNEDGMGLPDFPQYINSICEDQNVSAESIIKKADIDRTYGHQLFNGTRKPSRDKVILLAIAFGLDMDATQKLLLIADKPELYPRITRDAAIIFAINHKMDVQKTQEILFEQGLTLLGKNKQYEELS